MKYRELLAIVSPEKVDAIYSGGCMGCPDYIEGVKKRVTCEEAERDCGKCWDQDASVEDLKGVYDFLKSQSKKILEALQGFEEVITDFEMEFD